MLLSVALLLHTIITIGTIVPCDGVPHTSETAY